MCSGRVHKDSFYEKFNFRSIGETYLKEGNEYLMKEMISNGDEYSPWGKSHTD